MAAKVIPRLPDYVAPYVPVSSTLSRPSMARINQAATPPQEITLTLAGYDEVIPLVYGEDRTSGYWLVRPYTHIGSGELRFAIAWSWGGEQGIEGVQQIYFNGAALPGGVTVTHHYGTPDQSVDSILSADIPGFGDEYKYLAYTVFQIPPGTITGFPQQYQIEAVIRGIKVNDPRLDPPSVPNGRYFRITVTEASADPVFLNIADIAIRATVGGANQTGSGTASTSTSESVGFESSKAFDGNPLTTYSSPSPGTGPVWLKYDFGTAVDMAEIVITSGDNSTRAARAPRTFTIEVSDDDSAWTVVGGATSLPAWGITESRTFELSIGGDIVYSENPALCMADWISRPKAIGGMGKEVLNLTACADHCDQLLGTDKRCEIGLTIKHADYAGVMIDMWAAYAEVLWSWEGGKVLIVPDAPVDAPAAILTLDDIVEGSLQILGTRVTQSPTSVTINGRQPTGTAESWPQLPATQYAPGVETGDVDNIPSVIEMPGLHRFSEQARKALQRIRRLSHPARYPVQVFDEGFKFQRGDVIQLPNTKGLVDAQVRILGKQEVDPGVYQLECEHYSADMYPDDFIPGDTANWPEGSAFFFVGSEIPAGYELFEDADGYLLFGASATYPPGTITGDGSIDYGTQETTEDGAHGGTGEGAWIRTPTGTGATGKNYGGQEPDHKHSYTQTGAYSRVPYLRQERIIVKVGGSGEMPAQAQCMADGQIISSVLSEVSQHLGRLAAAGPSLNAGRALVFTHNDFGAGNLKPVFTPAGGHDHGLDGSLDDGPFFGPFPPAWNHKSEPNHTHGATPTFTLNIKRAQLAFFESSESCPAQIGLISMFLGDPEDLDGTGFYLCDGDNGTIDLEDYFIMRSSSSDAGVQVGDHTFSYEGETNPRTHNHQGSRSDMRKRGGFHQGDKAHKHQISGSGPYRPTGFSIRFIQYTGVI